MRRGTKIQKLKQALPGIVKDVRHYAKPRVKLHNEGLGDYYTEGYRSLNQREWKGVRDTAYDFASWLKVYGYMAVTLGKHPVALTKSFVRYPWMASYLTVANMLDRHKLGLRGKQLRYTQEQFYGVVHNSVDVIAKIIERDENLNSPNNKRAAKLRAKTVMFDEMTPSIIMAGFPMLDWIDIAMSPVCLPGEVDQNANIMYVDAAERMGLAADVCPLPSAEVGCAIVDDYPQVGSSFITSSMPCDGSLGAALFMDRYMKKLPSFTLTPPQRFNEPETNAYAVKDLKNCIRFIEETYHVKWDWDAFWEKAEEYNKTTQCMLDKWDVNCTPYPQVIGSALSLQREYEFQTAACLDPFMTKQDEKVTKMMLKGYEEDREADRRDYKYRAIVWCCPAHYYTHFTTWAEHTWGIRTLVDMESMLSYHFYHIGDKEQALTDMAMAYERMMMRSHSNGGYVNALDECWKMCEKFNANIVIMYDHVSCKNFGGLHGLFEDQDKAYQRIKKLEFAKFKIIPEGYMMLSSSMDQKEQVRVSKKAVKKGLDFATVGNLMIQRYKEEFQAKHVQILFITRELPVMDQLIAQGKKVDEITNAFDHILKNIILDCDLCPLHPICDDVEELRQIHFARK